MRTHACDLQGRKKTEETVKFTAVGAMATNGSCKSPMGQVGLPDKAKASKLWRASIVVQFVQIEGDIDGARAKHSQVESLNQASSLTRPSNNTAKCCVELKLKVIN